MHSLLYVILTGIFTLSSPDGKLNVSIDASNGVKYSVSYEGEQLVAPSQVSMTLEGGAVLGSGKVSKVLSSSVDKTVKPVVYKKSEVRDNYNQKTLRFANCDLIFRAYNEGVAYRFVARTKKAFKVNAETAEFRFPDNWDMTVPYVIGDNKSFEQQYFNSFENLYTEAKLQDWTVGKLAFAPVMVASDKGTKVVITEADLLDYPGMFLYNGSKENAMHGHWAPVPAKTHNGAHNNLQILVDEYHDYIAAYPANKAGFTEFPWRVMAVADKDYKLLDNDLVYLLAKADDGRDWSWVKPGKVAWDWWNDWNIKGVDFKSGVNNDTYKYYIDFASANGIEYVILDEGWAVSGLADLFAIVPEINLEEIISYASQRNVGIILWAGYYAFSRDLKHVCEHYSKMGVKGFKVDFMDGDNQQMVSSLYECARVAADYNLMLDYHGMYKPTGLHRTYPNVINFEGVHGLENMKWRSRECNQVKYDVQIPYLRFLAGPADYTQGAMRNATRSNYYPSNSEPMSQGTRCRQLAEYVVFASPLNMLCDSPSNYMAESECTKFIAEFPTVWDETVAIDGKVGESAVIARRSGDTWYIGGMNDWNECDMTIDLSRFGKGAYELYRDGVNADRNATDYKCERGESAPATLNVHLAPGGGFVIKLAR